MFEHPLPIGKFLTGWVPALAVSATVDPAPRVGDLFLIDLQGLPVPIVTCALGLLGIVLSRPFARRSEAELGLLLKLLVSAIMLVTVELWIVEARPSWLYAFVVSVGFGFAGYSLLELFGEQITELVRDAFTRARAGIGTSSTPPSSDATGPTERDNA